MSLLLIVVLPTLKTLNISHIFLHSDQVGCQEERNVTLQSRPDDIAFRCENLEDAQRCTDFPELGHLGRSASGASLDRAVERA